MAIITISRELAALGDETANELVKLMGYRLVDKKILEDRIKSFGIGDDKIKKYDERKPSLLAALSHDRDDYLHYLKTAVLAEAENGNCIFVGRGSRVVLGNLPGLVSVFLVSPPDIRVERVKSYFHCDEMRARQIIERSDQDRAGFHQYFFDTGWKDPDNYHMVLNTGTFSPANCAETIKQIKDSIVNAEAEARLAARLSELILEQKLRHHVIYEKEIPIYFFEATVSANTITLYGAANSQTQIDDALAAASELLVANNVGNSAKIQNEMQLVQKYHVMP